MNKYYPVVFLGLAMLLSGCMTSSKVQEMIEASNQDVSSQLETHELSIDVLKKSAMTGLEKSKENAVDLSDQQEKLEDITERMGTVQGYAEASKVMSAANTVKVADLADAVRESNERLDEAVLRFEEIDKLFESVMIAYYEDVIKNATSAIEQLKAEGVTANTNAPVVMDAPIEIVAPDTSTSVVESAISVDAGAAE